MRWLNRSVDRAFEGLGILPQETKQAKIAATCFACVRIYSDSCVRAGLVLLRCNADSVPPCTCLITLPRMQILASYFVAVPLRDEMGVLLGTSTLPKLVGSSVLVGIISQAATSSLLEHASLSKPIALRRFFRYLSACIAVCAVALVVTFELPETAALMDWSAIRRSLLQQSTDSSVNGAPLLPPLPPPPPRFFGSHGPPQRQFSVSTGDLSLSTARRTLFIIFYLWMGIQNLLAGSVMWARCADVFSAASAQRVFGVLAAAATCGQLVGAVGVQLLCRSTSQNMPLCAPPPLLCQLLPGGECDVHASNVVLHLLLCASGCARLLCSAAGMHYKRHPATANGSVDEASDLFAPHSQHLCHAARHASANHVSLRCGPGALTRTRPQHRHPPHVPRQMDNSTHPPTSSSTYSTGTALCRLRACVPDRRRLVQANHC